MVVANPRRNVWKLLLILHPPSQSKVCSYLCKSQPLWEAEFRITESFASCPQHLLLLQQDVMNACFHISLLPV